MLLIQKFFLVLKMKKCTRAKYAVKKPSRNSKFSTKPLHGLLSKMNENLDILK